MKNKILKGCFPILLIPKIFCHVSWCNLNYLQKKIFNWKRLLMFCSNSLILVIFPIIFQVLQRCKINLFWFYNGDKPVTVCTFVHILESCHPYLCIVRTIILSYYSVCQNNYLWLPMTITVTSFLTMHSLTVWTYFLLIWLHCIHNVNSHFILINPSHM